VRRRYVCEYLEHGGRVLYFVLIIFTAESGVPALTRPFFYLAAVSLLIYYLLWSRYFLRGSDYRLLFEPVLRVPLPMAVFPVLSLLFAALWLQSIPSVIAGAAFAVGHLVNSYIAYKQNIKRA
jgi:CDP-diglyceride synthetase